ncbi:MAG: tetratricopeptide repeat protein [Acidobacteria bacterium]|nr:tetratricopeptide repeat protein [Acidobacteriota bacterium]
MNTAQIEAKGERLLRRLETNQKDGAPYDALGIIALDHQSSGEAIELFTKAIELDGPVPAYCAHLGEAFARLGDYRSASACIGQALVGEPSSADLRWAYANLLHLQGENERAARNYELLVAQSPRHAEAWFNLGVTRARQNRPSEARKAYEQTVTISPTYAEAWNNLALLEVAAGNLSAAESSYRRALLVKPDYRDALYNFAVLLQEEERLQEAVTINERLVSIDPGFSEAHNNLGNCYLKLNRLAEAQNQYLETLAIHASHREAPMNLGLAALLMGDFSRGWVGYEHRLAQREIEKWDWKIPRWDGKLRPGENILVHAEQGFGDSIHFARYVRLLVEAEMKVHLFCQPAIQPLLASIDGLERCVSEIEALDPVDWQVPFPSLPYCFKTRLETIPNQVPYLKVDEARRANWSKLYAELPQTGRRVGLVWQGNPNHRNDRNRSLPLSVLAPLLNTAGFQFLSLQKGGAGTRIPEGIFDLAPLLGNFAETAAAIEGLDLVISVDTAVAHLAGSLGKPVWTLLPYAPDWRWLLYREDSPWYPSMRLFRQPIAGDWSSVVREVKRALNELA